LERIFPLPARIASLAPKSFEDARRLAALVPAGANAIEWRLDLSPGRISARALLDLDPRCAIVTYRSVREGGKFDGDTEAYRRSVQSAYDAGASVDVELESGLLADRDFLPDRRRVIGSRHGAALSEGRVRACMAAEVAAVKLVLTDPDTVAEALACVERGRRLSKEKPVACFATGTRGAVTRALSGRFGGVLTYGSVDGATAAGQPTLAELLDVYGADETRAPEKIFAVYGGDVSGSLSPMIHNALFRRRGLPWLYVALSASRRGASLDAPIAADLVALDGIGKNLAGVSVTNPFKSDFGTVAEADAETARIGAANTLVRRRPDCLDLSAHNTDVAAAREALVRLGGDRVLVFGTGGAARAAVVAGITLGRTVLVAGRDDAKAAAVALALGAQAVARTDVPSASVDVLVNATPLGGNDGDVVPFSRETIERASSVVDFVYRRGRESALVAEARTRGRAVVDGFELLARQAAGQAALFGVADATHEEIADILRGQA
jgi:shikimate dehydrogenase/3-dehydroquinate dehydratase type I